MTGIEKVVGSLPYEEQPDFPYQYSLEMIAKCEQAVGKPFPDDFRWYLMNIGWRKIDYDHRTILVRRGDYLHNLKFEAVEHEVFALKHYNTFAQGKEGGFLPSDGKLYFPFGQITGGNPQVALRLVISLNHENHGSIWTVRTIGHYGDQSPSQPIKISDDLVSFLQQVGENKKLSSLAEMNNESLFERLMADYRATAALKPTTAAEPETLIEAFFEQPDEMVFDGARNVEYQYRRHGQQIENEAEFEQQADWYATKLRTKPYPLPGAVAAERHRDRRAAGIRPQL